MEECPDVAPNELRTQRWASLDALRDDKIENEADLGRWFLSMDELFAEDASLEIVGLGRFDGRFEVKQYVAGHVFSFYIRLLCAVHIVSIPLFVYYTKPETCYPHCQYRETLSAVD